jgi:hypothetical protein
MYLRDYGPTFDAIGTVSDGLLGFAMMYTSSTKREEVRESTFSKISVALTKKWAV